MEKGSGNTGGQSRRAERGRRSGRRRSIGPMLIGILLLIITAGGYLSYIYVQRYMPTKERADLSEYFDVAGNNVQVYLNEEKQKTAKDYLVVGRYQNGHVYLPYDFVLDKLNRRFYWQEDNGFFLYSLPNETEMTVEGTLLPDGSSVFFLDGSNLYLNIEWICAYTDIRYFQSVDTEYKRIFLYDNWDSYPEAEIQKKEAVRLLGGVKSPVLTDLPEGSSVKILEKLDKWSRVLTEDGFMGYVRNSRLSEAKEVTPVSEFTAPDYSHLTLPEGQKAEIGFHQVTSAAANSGFHSLTQYVPGMNVVAPTWFVLSGNEGDFVSYASKDYVSSAHEKGYQVWATVNNFDLGSVDESILLKNYGLREQLIGGLVQQALENDIDGLNIDFELIPTELGADYVQFMRELSVACRNAGIILSVDNYVPYNYNSHYDLEELGVYCDYVIIMCYDEHYAGSEEAGSVASISYVDRGIQESMKLIPREQVIIALPFYTRVWISKADGSLSSDAMGISRAKQWISDKGVELSWDDSVGQNYGVITDDDGRKEIWMEDEESMALKMDHLRDAGVGGVAAWKLGQEPDGFFEILNLNE